MRRRVSDEFTKVIEAGRRCNPAVSKMLCGKFFAGSVPASRPLVGMAVAQAGFRLAAVGRRRPFAVPAWCPHSAHGRGVRGGGTFGLPERRLCGATERNVFQRRAWRAGGPCVRQGAVLVLPVGAGVCRRAVVREGESFLSVRGSRPSRVRKLRDLGFRE